MTTPKINIYVMQHARLFSPFDIYHKSILLSEWTEK